MKIKIIIFLTLALIVKSPFAQDKSSLHWDVGTISLTQWNTPDGLPYSEGPGVNLGANSFAVIDQNNIAFLCSSTNEIIIINTIDGRAIKKITIGLSPRDFIYDNHKFYVLTESEITVYDDSGKILNQFPYNVNYAVERLMRYNNSTFLLLPTGNSLKVESLGKSIAEEYRGWMTLNGDFVVIELQGDNNYFINISRSSKIFNKTLTTNKKVAGVYVIGSTENRLFLDVQTFLSENPIAVERHIISVEIINNVIGDIISEIKVPDCYYVFSSKDIYLTPSGHLLNMVTSPDGVFIFSLNESNSIIIKEYPVALQTINYHFNYHLINIEE